MNAWRHITEIGHLAFERPVAASIADPVLTDQIFFPVSAAYAENAPLASPWKTRFPAVPRTPPLTDKGSVTTQRAACVMGSNATSLPRATFVFACVLPLAAI